MPWKNNQIIIKRVQFSANRCYDLFIIPSYKVCPPNTPVEKRISAKYTVRFADEADTAACMSWCV